MDGNLVAGTDTVLDPSGNKNNSFRYYDVKYKRKQILEGSEDHGVGSPDHLSR